MKRVTNSLFSSCVLLVLLCSTACTEQKPAAEKEAIEIVDDQLVPFSKDDLWGYQTPTGAPIIEPQFVLANPFNEEGGATVVDGNGWAYINMKGEVLLRPFIYDNGPDDFKEGLARFVQDGKMGFYAPSGVIVIPATYDFILPFENGVAKVCNGCEQVRNGEHFTVEGGTWRTIDKAGKIIEP